MANKKYTAAVIGTGRIGFTLGFDKKREQPASHTMALMNNRRVHVIAGCDSDRFRLERWADYVGNPFCSTETAPFFATVKPEILVISVNEDSHLKVALEALNSNPKLIILEKPVALNMKQGYELKFVADLRKVPVLVNHERRFAEDYRIAKEYISRIGAVQTVNARLDSGLYVYNPEKEQNGEYSLLHDGTHLVDVVMYLLEGEESPKEPVLRDFKLTSVYYDKEKPEVVRNASVHCRCDKCNDVNLFFSGRSRYFGFEVEVIGTEGRFKVGNGIFEFYTRKESRLYTGFYSLLPDRTVRQPKKTGYFSNMVQNAVDFLDGKAPLRSTLRTGLNALQVLEEIKSFF